MGATFSPHACLPDAGADYITTVRQIRHPSDLALGRNGGRALIGPTVVRREMVTLEPGQFCYVLAVHRKRRPLEFVRALIECTGPDTIRLVDWSEIEERVRTSSLPQPILDKARQSEEYLVAAFTGLTINPQDQEA